MRQFDHFETEIQPEELPEFAWQDWVDQFLNNVQPAQSALDNYINRELDACFDNQYFNWSLGFSK